MLSSLVAKAWTFVPDAVLRYFGRPRPSVSITYDLLLNVQAPKRTLAKTPPRLPPEIQHLILTQLLDDASLGPHSTYFRTIFYILRASRHFWPVVRRAVKRHNQEAVLDSVALARALLRPMPPGGLVDVTQLDKKLARASTSGGLMVGTLEEFNLYEQSKARVSMMRVGGNFVRTMGRILGENAQG